MMLWLVAVAVAAELKDPLTSKEWDSRRQRLEPYEVELMRVSENRSKLLFKHVAKCGGSYAKGLMAAAAPGYTLRAEKGKVSAEDMRDHFVISVIREPCAWYLSLWAFASRGVLGRAMAKLDIYPTGKPPHENARNLKALRRFVTDSHTAGLFASRFLTYFGTRAAVDCWVDTANLVEDATSCLRKFEAQGGTVRWRKVRDFFGGGGKRRLASPGTRNASPHAACGLYYPPDLASFVRNASFDAPLQRFFNWDACCTPTQCPRCG